MRRSSLYIINPDRSVKRHSAKVRLPGYLDNKEGRWLLEQRNIFHDRPLAFEDWDAFLAWQPEPVTPKNPAVLAIAGDVMLQSPVPITDPELAESLIRPHVAAAQDLMTSVGHSDGHQSALTWAMAGVMAVCAVAIMVIIMMSAATFLGGEPERPRPPELAPSMSAATPWPGLATSTTPQLPRQSNP